MKLKNLILSLLSALALALMIHQTSQASEEGKGHEEHASAETEKHAHGHEHGDEAEEHEEENSSVGPDKGITKYDEHDGFQLADSAKKTFRLTTVAATPGAAMTLPSEAIFYGLEERNVFRVRDGFFKRIDFKLINKSKGQVTVQIPDLKAGDLIVTSGLGFLRIAEIAASGGGAVGHAH